MKIFKILITSILIVSLQTNASERISQSERESKMGDKDKSDSLKRLHKAAVSGESKGVPLDFINELIDNEWNHAENNGGKTFMGNVVKGLTRKVMDTQNGVLYGRDSD